MAVANNFKYFIVLDTIVYTARQRMSYMTKCFTYCHILQWWLVGVAGAGVACGYPTAASHPATVVGRGRLEDQLALGVDDVAVAAMVATGTGAVVGAAAVGAGLGRRG